MLEDIDIRVENRKTLIFKYMISRVERGRKKLVKVSIRSTN